MTDKRTITVSVNGIKHSKEVPVRITLADFIRYELGLTGTHLVCEHGVGGCPGSTPAESWNPNVR